MGAFKKQKEVETQIRKIHGDKILLDRFIYTYASKKTWFGCAVNSEHPYWQNTPSHIKNGQGCPKCGRLKSGKTRRHTKETIEEMIKEVHGNNISFKEFIYHGFNTHSIFLCNINPKHTSWTAQPANILAGTGCPDCKDDKTAKRCTLTQEEAENIIIQKHGNILLLDKFIYTLSRNSAVFGCKIHGYWETITSSVLRGGGCPKCAGKNMTTEECSNRIKDVHGSDISLDKFIYNGCDEKSIFGCNIDKTHRYWTATPYKICNGRGCPTCSSSKNERKIIRFLNTFLQKYEYECQKTFDGCKYINLLRFDFYIKKYNICIEFNGGQHYKHNDFFGGIEKFELQKICDFLKVEYCKQNGIKLFIICYDENVEERLYEIFKSVGVMLPVLSL